MGPTSGFDILMITPTDYDQMWNNVEHGRVRQYPKLGCRMTVLGNKVNQSTSIWGMVRDCCLWRTGNRQWDGVSLIQVDPFFNCRGGIRVHADVARRAGPRKSSWRYLLVKLFAPASVLRDLFFVPCFVLTGLFKLGRSFDVCLGVGPWGVLVGWILGKLGRARLLVYIDRDHEPGMRSDRLRRSYTAFLERFLLRRVDCVVTVGHRLKKLRETQTHVPVTLIPNGVDWDRFEETRRVWRDGKRLFYVGNLISWDGLDVVIQAMPKIIDAHGDAKLIIVGDGVESYGGFLHDEVRRLGLEGAVTFLGSQTNESLPQLMMEAEIGLANSRPVDYRKYACPLKAFEYMAAGLPVLATEDTEAADIVAEAKAGLAAACEPDAVAKAAISMLDDREAYDRMRQNAVQYSAACTWEELVKKELKLVASCYERRFGTTRHADPTMSEGESG